MVSAPNGSLNIRDDFTSYIEESKGTAALLIARWTATPIEPGSARNNLHLLMQFAEEQAEWKTVPKLCAVREFARLTLEADFAQSATAKDVSQCYERHVAPAVAAPTDAHNSPANIDNINRVPAQKKTMRDDSDSTASAQESAPSKSSPPLKRVKRAPRNKSAASSKHDSHSHLDKILGAMLKKTQVIDREIAQKEADKTISYRDYEAASAKVQELIFPIKEKFLAHLRNPNASPQEKLDAAEGLVYLVNGFPISKAMVQEAASFLKEAEETCSQFLAHSTHSSQAKKVLQWLKDERESLLPYNSAVFFSKYVSEKVVNFMKSPNPENPLEAAVALELLMEESINNFLNVIETYKKLKEPESLEVSRNGLAAEYELLADFYFHLATKLEAEQKLNYLEKASQMYEKARVHLVDPEKIKLIDLSIFNAREERAVILRTLNYTQAAILEFELLLSDLNSRLLPEKHYSEHFQIICNELDCLIYLYELTQAASHKKMAQKRVQFYLKNQQHWPNGIGDREEIEQRITKVKALPQ